MSVPAEKLDQHRNGQPVVKPDPPGHDEPDAKFVETGKATRAPPMETTVMGSGGKKGSDLTTEGKSVRPPPRSR